MKRELLEEIKKQFESGELNEVLLKHLFNKEILINLEEGVEKPVYAKIGDAGLDFRSNADIKIYPGEKILLSTGIRLAMPSFVQLEIRGRSGNNLNRPLDISIGTIDEGYRDEIGIIIKNNSEKKYKLEIKPEKIKKAIENPAQGVALTFGEIVEDKNNYNTYSIEDKENKSGIYEIKKGDRIAQGVFAYYIKAKLKEVELKSLREYGTNRGGGFGTSGTK